MPKKTKKEKLLALYHKKLSLLENRPVTPPTPTQTYRRGQDIQKKNVVTEPSIVAEEKELNKFFISDLKKSLILIAFIIAAEISLYASHLIK